MNYYLRVLVEPVQEYEVVVYCVASPSLTQ